MDVGQDAPPAKLRQTRFREQQPDARVARREPSINHSGGGKVARETATSQLSAANSSERARLTPVSGRRKVRRAVRRRATRLVIDQLIGVASSRQIDALVPCYREITIFPLLAGDVRGALGQVEAFKGASNACFESSGGACTGTARSDSERAAGDAEVARVGRARRPNRTPAGRAPTGARTAAVVSTAVCVPRVPSGVAGRDFAAVHIGNERAARKRSQPCKSGQREREFD